MAVEVSLRDGNRFLLDLAGAQYGQNRPLMPLRAYCAEYTVGVSTPHAFGHQQRAAGKIIDQNLTSWAERGHDAPAYILQRHIAKTVHSAVDAWEVRNSFKLPAMLTAKEEIYLAAKAQLLNMVVGDINDYMTWWKSSQGPVFKTIGGRLVFEHGTYPPTSRRDVPDDESDASTALDDMECLQDPERMIKTLTFA